MSRLRSAVALASPRRRRWLRFLRELRIDPDRLPRPLPAPGGNDFIMCGAPRTGTTLLCAALYQPPAVVTVMEPWDGMRLPPAELFGSLRSELATTGRLKRGRLDLTALEQEGAARWCQEGEAERPVAYGPDSLVGVKWPAYWRYLDLLPDTKFLVCLRHPYEVVASFKNAGGLLREGLQYGAAFYQALNEELRSATDDVAVRRVLLHDYVNERLLPSLSRPNVLTVRYERWFQDPEALMAEIGAFLGVALAPPPVRIRRPSRPPALTTEEKTQVRELCRTAGALGYRLDAVADGDGDGDGSASSAGHDQDGSR